MELIEKLDRFRDDSLAGPWLQEAMQSGPDLISAELEGAAIGDVADVVIGQLEDIPALARFAARPDRGYHG
jgi:hypothetical protein